MVQSPTSQPTRDFSSIPMASSASPFPIDDGSGIPSLSPLTDGMLSKMDLGKLWRWILCICTVNFDLDKGQDLEFVYPPLEFTNEEKKTL
jgi:hypothetical protein